MAAASVRVSHNGWIGVDLDGTLSQHTEGLNISTEIGPPVDAMLHRVILWWHSNCEVRIMTARVSSNLPEEFRKAQRKLITNWCLEHLGFILPITSEKDFNMIELWDDRARRVEANTGRLLG